MPPIHIAERIASLSDTHKECMSLISRLSKLPGGAGTDVARTELANLIHQTLREAETSYELLEDEAVDLSDKSNTAAIKSKVGKIGEDLKIARLRYRKAQLAAKHNAEATSKSERDALFGDAPARAMARRTGNEKLSEQEYLMAAGSDVTAALRRTQQLLHGELVKSRFASETLAQSTEALRDLSQRYSVFDDILGKSTALIRDLVKKNKSDRWYYETAIQILVGILVWIIVRRLLWGPIWLLLVWPLKTAWWTFSSLVGIGAGFVAKDTAATTTGVMQAPTGVYIPHGIESVLVDIPQKGAAIEKGEVIEHAEALLDSGEVTMIEAVSKIIDGEPPTVIQRNPKSRRFEEENASSTSLSEPSVASREPSQEPEPQTQQEEVPEQEEVQEQEEVPEQQEEEQVQEQAKEKAQESLLQTPEENTPLQPEPEHEPEKPWENLAMSEEFPPPPPPEREPPLFHDDL